MNWKTMTKSTVVLAMALSGLVACGDDDDDENTSIADQTTPGTLANYLANDTRFTVLTQLLSDTGLLETLDGSGSFTVFAPTDAAFSALPDTFIAAQNFAASGRVELLTSSVSSGGISTILQGHVIGEDLDSAAVLGETSLDTILSGFSLAVDVVDPTPADGFGETEDDIPVIGGRAQLLQVDQSFSNGTVHVVDTVFVPTTQLAAAGEIDTDAYPGTLFQYLEATPLFSPVLDALFAAGETGTLSALNDTASSFTLFVPGTNLAAATESAEASALANVLDLHILSGVQDSTSLVTAGFAETTTFTQLTVDASGSPATVETVNLISADQATSNGIVHLIEGILPTPADSPADLITTDRDFSSLVGALESVGADGVALEEDSTDETLLDTLRADDATITLFAPNNSAFANLDALAYELDDDPTTGTIAEVTDDENLGDVLLYHVSAAVDDLTTVPSTIVTLSGAETIEASSLGTGMMPPTVLNGLLEVLSTASTSGGSAVHTIGSVLLPTSLGVTRPQDTFPGPSSQALAYFTIFSGFAAGAEATSVPYNATAGATTATFGGTLLDISRFVEGDPTLLDMSEEAPFENALVSPFAADTDGDGELDTNFSIPETTLFVPLDPSLEGVDPAEVAFDADIEGYEADDVFGFHAVFGRNLASSLTSGSFETLTVQTNGDTGQFSIDIVVDAGVTVEGQAVLYPDLETDNGVIHAIGAPVIPSP